MVFTWDDVDKAEMLLARFLDHQDLLRTLTEDVLLLGIPGNLSAPGRRSFLRTNFALVEGGISSISTCLIEGCDLYGWPIAEDDKRVLWDAVHSPSTERPDGGRASFLERSKTAFKAGAKCFRQQPFTDFSGFGYQAYARAVRVRDRLMHPKRSADLEVSNGDLTDAVQGREWFRAGAKQFFQCAAFELTTEINKLRRLG
jgi:hypothetical protein